MHECMYTYINTQTYMYKMYVLCHMRKWHGEAQTPKGRGRKGSGRGWQRPYKHSCLFADVGSTDHAQTWLFPRDHINS